MTQPTARNASTAWRTRFVPIPRRRCSGKIATAYSQPRCPSYHAITVPMMISASSATRSKSSLIANFESNIVSGALCGGLSGNTRSHSATTPARSPEVHGRMFNGSFLAVRDKHLHGQVSTSTGAKLLPLLTERAQVRVWRRHCMALEEVRRCRAVALVRHGCGNVFFSSPVLASRTCGASPEVTRGTGCPLSWYRRVAETVRARDTIGLFGFWRQEHDEQGGKRAAP